MAGTRKRAAAVVQSHPETSSPVEVTPEPTVQITDSDEEGHEDNPNLPALKFRHALTWKAGKAIDVGELIKRLSALHKELGGIDHGGIRLSTVLPVAQELCHLQLLNHKDRGVQACLAVCIVDVFRLFAPHAPYKEKQLKDIFTMFVDSIIPALARRDDPYHEPHLVVLRALYEFELLAILSDFTSIDGLVARLYMKVFDMFSSTPGSDAPDDGPSQTVYVNLQEALTGLAASYETLPKGVVDVILAQFLRVDPSIFRQPAGVSDSQREHSMNQVPLSYNMAQSICNGAAEIMTRAISQYFSAIIIDASETTSVPAARTATNTGKRRRDDDVLDDEMLSSGPSAAQLEDLRKAHCLLRELWRSCPDITQSVVLQVNAELSVENVDIRAIATETIGDMVAGIGAAGAPSPSILDPAAYPSIAVEPAKTKPASFFVTPLALHPFSSVHPAIYQTYMTRKQDRAPQVRAVYAATVGRILSTSAGGLGLDHDEEQALLDGLAEMLLDRDDKVRLAAVRAVAYCDYDTIIQKIGKHNGVEAHGSVLYNLADRIRDPRPIVRAEAMRLLGQLWGVASAAIAEGSERQHELFGPIPSKILEALYINEPTLTASVLETVYTCLLPINFPPSRPKAKGAQTSRGSQRSQRRQDLPQTQDAPYDADKLRSERILLLANDLTEKAKTVFFALQRQQVLQARYLGEFLDQCEAYNGGIATKNNDLKVAKAALNKYVTFLAKPLPDPMSASDHIWKFIKTNNKRCFILMRMTVSPEKEYTVIKNAIKELSTNILGQGKGNADMLATLMAILYKCGLLAYNRSHVPTVTEYARNDEKGLGSIAHEVLKEILDNHPEVLEAHVRGICEAVVKDAPTPGQVTDNSTVKSLKACASFAQRDPDAMPDDRAFLQSMVKFALHGQPPKAAKHAITVIVSIKKRKDMYVRDIVRDCTESFVYGEEGFLSKLASVSQLMLLAASDIDDGSEQIESIAIKEVLLRPSTSDAPLDDTQWSEVIDDDCMAKMIALKILANRLRYFASATSDAQMEETLKEMATKVYQMLIKILKDDGELSSDGTTPGPHRAWLRLTAAVLLLKLSCASKLLENCLTPANFQLLALVAQDPLPEVRSKFLRALRKYLGQSALPARFYTIPFLVAFEPSRELKEATATWLRARASTLAKAGETTMELTLARFISLLVHHPDFSMDASDLAGFPQYIVFYLKSVATRSNIPLIYHVAQRVKSVQDGLDHDSNEGLYCLSEIAQTLIREYAESNNWQLPAWNGKLRMPAGIFEQLPSHARAQQIADKQFAPQELLDGLDEVVRDAVKGKKRKAESSAPNGQSRKRVKSNATRPKAVQSSLGSTMKTPRKSRSSDVRSSPVDASARRRSARTSKAKSYADLDDSEDEDVNGAGDDDSGAQDESEEEAEDDDNDEDEDELKVDGTGSDREEGAGTAQTAEDVVESPENGEADQADLSPSPRSSDRQNVETDSVTSTPSPANRTSRRSTTSTAKPAASPAPITSARAQRARVAGGSTGKETMQGRNGAKLKKPASKSKQPSRAAAAAVVAADDKSSTVATGGRPKRAAVKAAVVVVDDEDDSELSDL